MGKAYAEERKADRGVDFAAAISHIPDLGEGASVEQDVERDRSVQFDRARGGLFAAVHDAFFHRVERADENEAGKGGGEGEVEGKVVAGVPDVLEEEMAGDVAQKEASSALSLAFPYRSSRFSQLT